MIKFYNTPLTYVEILLLEYELLLNGKELLAVLIEVLLKNQSYDM